MPGIFLSYRREDSEYVTGQIHRYLSQRFGIANITFDVSSIPLGTDFRTYIRQQVEGCEVLVAVIGPGWLEARDAQGQRRLNAPGDFVRIEIEEGLKRNIPVVPLLLNRATVPSAEHLPPLLQPLAYRNGMSVRPDPYFEPDMQIFCDRIVPLLKAAPVATPLPAAASLVPPPTNVWAALERALGLTLPARLKSDELGFTPLITLAGQAVLIPPTVEVAAGAFWMGTKGNRGDEPWHEVTLGAYRIGVYPVTVAEYALYLQANPVATPPPDLIFGKNDQDVASAWWGKTLTWTIQLAERADHPVVGVSWFDARAFVRWLDQVTGEAVWRLPTEAEWEKAARWDARTQEARVYPWGDPWDKTKANTRDWGPGGTTPVGQYVSFGDASPYGCHDMAGNVWEWCSSVYFSADYQPDNKRENRDNRTNYRVLRGGSWKQGPEGSRAALRNWDYPGSLNGRIGFRVASGGRGAS